HPRGGAPPHARRRGDHLARRPARPGRAPGRGHRAVPAALPYRLGKGRVDDLDRAVSTRIPAFPGGCGRFIARRRAAATEPWYMRSGYGAYFRLVPCRTGSPVATITARRVGELARIQ